MTVIVLVKTVGYNIIIDNFRCFDSAGCGRTGTICAVDYAWDVLKCGVSLFSVICCSPLWEKVMYMFSSFSFDTHLDFAREIAPTLTLTFNLSLASIMIFR